MASRLLNWTVPNLEVATTIRLAAEERADAVEARLLARVGAPPSLDDYRRAYASCGAPWPGDDEVRQLHPVAS